MKLQRTSTSPLVGLALCAAAFCAAASAQESEDAFLLPGFVVVGDKESVQLLPGSATFLEAADLARHNYDDINQVIRSIPGVYVRQEDGYGLFPNVSIRGVSSMRSSKVTVMEDGILTAPAPYAAPSAYYTPNSGRMAGFEILKGSSQIRFGPHTTGGVLNYLSTPLPAYKQGFASLSYGSDNDFRGHVWFGDTVDLQGGARFSYLLENYYRKTDGFKTIDGTAATPRSKETGFEKNDPMLKLRFETADQRQSIEAKFGYSNMDADETYLGLTDADFRADPYRRYAASRFDNIDTTQFRSYLRHRIALGDNAGLTTTLYHNEFKRSWYKLNDARAAEDTSYRNLSEILAGQHGQASLDVLKGEAAGQLRVRNNNRSYEGQGIESALRIEFGPGELTHELDIGIRLHRDFEDRFQADDVYLQNAQGGIDAVTNGRLGTQDNRRGKADATSLYLMDRISFGKWALTPGIRYENVQYTNIRRSTADDDTFNSVLPGFPAKRTVDAFTPGVGFTYAAGERLSYFGGVHRGVSMPGPGDAIGDLTEETSLGWELGTRFQSTENAVWGEFVWFLTDFDDLIVPSNIGGGGGSSTSNIGEVRSWGFETLVGWDPARSAGANFRAPTTLTFTWTDATLRNDVNAAGSGGASVESIFAGGRKGNRVPYIPDYQINLSTGLEFDAFSFFLNAFYVDSVYATANNTDLQRQGADADGVLDSRFGKSDGYFLVDVSARYRLNETFTLKAGVENLLDREYMASRVPHGARPGRPRSVSVGFDASF